MRKVQIDEEISINTNELCLQERNTIINACYDYFALLSRTLKREMKDMKEMIQRRIISMTINNNIN